MQNGFSPESGAQRVLFDEKKTEGRKSRDSVPLKHQNIIAVTET
jgi:hypothetical protein